MQIVITFGFKHFYVDMCGTRKTNECAIQYINVNDRHERALIMAILNEAHALARAFQDVTLDYFKIAHITHTFNFQLGQRTQIQLTPMTWPDGIVAQIDLHEF